MCIYTCINIHTDHKYSYGKIHLPLGTHTHTIKPLQLYKLTAVSNTEEK